MSVTFAVSSPPQIQFFVILAIGWEVALFYLSFLLKILNASLKASGTDIICLFVTM